MFRSIFTTIFRGDREQYYMQRTYINGIQLSNCIKYCSRSPLKMVVNMDRNM